MRKSSIVCIAAFVTLSLSTGEVVRPAHATHKCEDYGLKPVGLFVDGQSAEAFVAETLAEPNGVLGFLQELRITGPSGEELIIEEELTAFANLLQQINEDPTLSEYGEYVIPNALKGIAGFSTSILLQRLVFVDKKPIATKVFYGKIRDYTFDQEKKRGHLNVDTCIDNIDTNRRELFHWDVEVPAGEFGVTPRDDSNTSNPFGTDVQLPDAALDPAHSHSIWARGLDHKLGAKGEEIRVLHIYRRDLSTATPPPPLTRLPSEPEPMPSILYTSTADSCIDLLTEGEPPATFAELVGNDYCLGRCGHPAIYNSGD